MSIEVLLNNSDISVIGPPDTVELQLDVGGKGARGSQIFSGFDNPNTTPPDEAVLPNDIFIRESQGQTEGYIYQYLSDGAGGFQWEKIGSLKPSIYSEVVSLGASAGSLSASAGSLSASAGIYTYQVSISEAFTEYSATSISANNLHVQISTEFNDAPVVTSVKTKSVDNVSNVIDVGFYSIYYNSASTQWLDLSDTSAKHHVTLSLLA
jgi:hypothetical protein